MTKQRDNAKDTEVFTKSRSWSVVNTSYPSFLGQNWAIWPQTNYKKGWEMPSSCLFRKKKWCDHCPPLLLTQWSLYCMATLIKWIPGVSICWSIFYRFGKNLAKSEAITEENKADSFCSSHCYCLWTLPWLWGNKKC